MSYYQDFLDEVERWEEFERRHPGKRAIVPGEIVGPGALNPIDPFSAVAELMKTATIVRVSGEQAAAFFDLAIDPSQDFKTWLRLPFPQIYLQLESPMTFSRYTMEDVADLMRQRDECPPGEERERLTSLIRHGDPRVKGVLLHEFAHRQPGTFHLTQHDGNGHALVDPLAGGSWEETPAESRKIQVVRAIQAAFLMPIPNFPLNMHGATVVITDENQLGYSMRGHRTTTRRACEWIVHMVNFLSSPSVKLVRAEPSPALQKARARRGKSPLPGWYEITYRKHIKEYTRDKLSPKRWEHSFRYDVRGHFKTWTRGPMAGRVTWTPKHQRGLRHSLYKPKGYRAEEVRG